MVDAHGDRAARGRQIFGPDLLYLKDLSVPAPAPYGAGRTVVFAPDGSSAYLMAGPYIYRMNIADGKVLERFKTVAPGALWLAFQSKVISTQQVGDASTRISIIDVSQYKP
jgi:hypothetical protein